MLQLIKSASVSARGELVKAKLRETAHDSHSFEADGGDVGDQVDDVAGLVVLAGPVVGVVDDT